MRRAHPSDNAVMLDVSYSTVAVLGTFDFCHPGKWTAFVLTGFFFPSSPLSNESILNHVTHLNKFYTPYQNSNINSTCRHKIPRKLQRTSACNTFSQNGTFRWQQSYKVSTHSNDMQTLLSTFSWWEQKYALAQHSNSSNKHPRMDLLHRLKLSKEGPYAV